MVSRQQEHGEAKRAGGEGSPRAWEAGRPAGGKLAVPTVPAGAGLREGRRESLGTEAGQEGQEGFTLSGL